jgi:hypothetical protein
LEVEAIRSLESTLESEHTFNTLYPEAPHCHADNAGLFADLFRFQAYHLTQSSSDTRA